MRNLFFNTPVRRKFLRSVPTEFGHLSEQFTRIALASPRLSAVLRHNERMVYELPATDQVLDRLRLFFGSDLADRLIWIESQTDTARLWGYVGHPSESRSTRKGQYLFLNGRFIQDRSLQHALGEAYRGLLMTGRYPVAFLFLELAPELVDVNIHPTKAEVRFRDSQSLYRQLLSTLRTRFLTAELESNVSLPAGLQLAPPGTAIDPNRQLDLQLQVADWAKDRLAQWTPPTSFPAAPGQMREHPGSVADPFAPFGSAPFSAAGWGGPGAADRPSPPGDFPFPQAATPAPAPVVPSPMDSASAASPPRQIMQVHDCYLVVETDEGITVIDQHALHERVMYEHLRARVMEGAVESQKTLVPEPLEFGPREAAALLEHKDLLSCLGYGIEDFGGTTLLLAAYPAMLAHADHARILADIADQLAAAGQKPSRRDILDSLLHLMACKAAVKAGQRLKPEEMESLLAQRHLIDDAHHCPHGRPTALRLDPHRVGPAIRQTRITFHVMICVIIGRTRHKMVVAEHRALAGERPARRIAARLAQQSARLACPAGRAAHSRHLHLPPGTGAGTLRGSEEQRQALLRAAIAGGADYVDLEPDIAGSVRRYGNTKRIVSYHNFEETPEDLEEIHERLTKLDPDIVKIVTMANSAIDSVRDAAARRRLEGPHARVLHGRDGPLEPRPLRPLRLSVHVLHFQFRARVRPRANLLRGNVRRLSLRPHRPQNARLRRAGRSDQTQLKPPRAERGLRGRRI